MGRKKKKDSNKDNRVELYTDGGNRVIDGKNIGGYAAYIHSNDPKNQVMIVGSEFDTTNNRMELCGVIEGLSSIPENSKVDVYTDSQYVVNAFNKNWIINWEKKDFKGVKNSELWKSLLDEKDKHKEVTFHWVKGHSSNDKNNLCDRLATAVMFSSTEKEN